MIRIAVATLALFAFSSVSYAGCSMTSAGGIGATKDIAEFMSNKALKDMTAKLGEKGTGKVETSCTTTLVVTNCVSKQKTCK